MQKLYLDLRHVSAIPDAYKRPSAEISALSGKNLGNFAFRHALRFIVEELESYRPLVWSEVPAAVAAGPVERVLVSCANWLGVSPADEASNLNRARAIESVDAPVTAFGLGVQAKSGEASVRLGPNTERLARALAERSERLSVRDKLTQETLEELGILNTVVTGCPSNFINPDPELGAKIGARARMLMRAAPEWRDIRVAVSEYSGGHGRGGAVLRRKLALLDEAPAFYVAQSPALLPFLFREERELPADYRAADPFAAEPGKLARVLKARTLHFSDFDGWLDFCRTCELSFGMRIHGTMAPLQAGTPSLLVSHDARTSGLAAEMGVPALPPERFLAAMTAGPAEIFGHVARKMDGYDARRRELAGVMRGLLDAAGLAVSPHFAALAETPLAQAAGDA